MTPDCLIDFANKLLDTKDNFASSEAAERSAVSRSYYAMHLTLTCVCDANGWPYDKKAFDIKPDPGSHNRPILALKRAARNMPQSRRDSVTVLANKIERYRKARVIADYYLTEQLGEAEIRRCAKQARQIVDDLLKLVEPAKAVSS